MTRWIGVVLVLAGCDAGYAQPCCVGEDGRAVLQGMGRVGQCTCASGAVCEYGMFTSCNDDSTRCVVSFSSPGNVTCAGGTAMTDVPCCIERDAEGIGSRSMCECPVFGECEGGLHGEWIEAIDETHCRLATPPWIDAGAPDAGG